MGLCLATRGKDEAGGGWGVGWVAASGPGLGVVEMREAQNREWVCPGPVASVAPAWFIYTSIPLSFGPHLLMCAPPVC